MTKPLKGINFPGLPDTYYVPIENSNIGNSNIENSNIGNSNIENSNIEGGNIKNFVGLPLSVPANTSVKFQIVAHTILVGRAINGVSSPAVYAFSTYSDKREPLVAELSAGDGIAVSTSGNNTDGWYIKLANDASQTAMFYFMGSSMPIFI
jgi:hypothetical protein